MGANCCQPNHALIIKEIVAEDNMRRGKALAPPKKINYNENTIRYIQRFIKNHLYRKKFFEQFNQMQRFIIEELKQNFIKLNNTPIKSLDKMDGDYFDINHFTNQKVREMEAKVGKYENTPYYIENINKVKANRFIIDLPPLYVDILHNNDVYKGMWNIQKKFHGYGILIKSDGSKYQGFWNQSILNGIGRYFTIQGDFFEGNFLNGVATGFGIFIHYDGTTYKGEWLNDQTHGKGEEIFPDKSYFKGYFKEGKKNGRGRFAWADGSCYEGDIVDDTLHGMGVYIWADRRTYEGEWVNNHMQGKGIMKFSKGSMYIGEFYESQRSGMGKYIWNENKYYEGTWFNGKQHGKGKYVKNGKIIEGIWNNGKIMNHQVINTTESINSNNSMSGLHESREITNGFSNGYINNIPQSHNILPQKIVN
jgi:hypothetical protein